MSKPRSRSHPAPSMYSPSAKQPATGCMKEVDIRERETLTYFPITLQDYGGAMAQWLERATDDRVVVSLNLSEAAWKVLAISFTPLCLCLSEVSDSKSRRSLLSRVYARGSKRSHTGDKCVTCRGLHILPGQ